MRGNESRAQSAIEFLMTYGWAIVILLAVVVILFYLGVFNPKTVSPRVCVLPSGFACQDYKIEGSDSVRGALTLVLVQNMGHTISIDEIACSENDTPTYTSVNEELHSGDRITLNANCTKADGTTPPNVDEYYSGHIYVLYTDEETNVQHKAVGEIAFRVESASATPTATPISTPTPPITPTPGPPTPTPTYA